MRIDSGTIGMESARSYKSIKSSSKQYTVKIDRNKSFDNNLFDTMNVGVRAASGMDEKMSYADRMQKLREECINLLLRLLFPDRNLDLSDEGTVPADSSGNAGQSRIGITYHQEYYYQEEEYTSFEARGIVRCSDGREIEFGLNLEMGRSFCEYYSEEVDFLAEALCDPLVINFDGNITELSDQTIRFDIDCDGVEDEINNLVAGCGFLALDENEDGIINDGSELFGTSSGNGFADLARFDTDHDGFIDEDDEIFDKLKVMTIDSNGTQHLYSLLDKDIGAVCLTNAGTQFSLNSVTDNSGKGIIRNTGVFLKESGGVGTIQQIDLVKHQRAVAAYA